MPSVQGKVVWITGASGGLGEAMAREAASRGAKVVLSARREEELKRVQRELKLTDKNSLLLPLDLEKPEKIQLAVSRVLLHFGTVDFLINNAGVSQRSLILETDMSVYRRLVEVNFFGTIALTKAVLPTMIAKGGGSIAVISSVAGKCPTPLRSGYNACKFALDGWFGSLRAEMAANNINVTIIYPGFIKTLASVNALRGDGSTWGIVDPKVESGIDPAVFAKEAISAVERGTRERVIASLRERFGVFAKTFLPFLYWYLIPRLAVK